MFKLTLAIVALALYSANADQVMTLPSRSPVIIKDAGKPVNVTWPSGNQAELKLNRNVAIDIPVEYKVYENSCSQETGQKFVVTFPVRGDRVTYIWTKHTDASKLGKPVMIGGTTFSAIFLIGNGFRARFNDVVGNLGDDYFAKDKSDLSFVPGLEGPFREFTVRSWFSENMIKNSETGVPENRVTASVSDVHVNIEGKIDLIGATQEMGSLDNQFLLVGDVVTWLIETPRGLCQVSAKADLQSAIEIVTKYLGALPDTYEAYNWKSDSLTTMILERPEASLLKDENLVLANE